MSDGVFLGGNDIREFIARRDVERAYAWSRILRTTVRSRSLWKEGNAMGSGGFMFAVSPWLVIPVLLLLVLGGMKLVKLLLMALKG